MLVNDFVFFNYSKRLALILREEWPVVVILFLFVITVQPEVGDFEALDSRL